MAAKLMDAGGAASPDSSSSPAADEKAAAVEVNAERRAVDSQLGDIAPDLERRITRKFDFHILPWLFAIWLFAFIDRSNIGNARIDGLSSDLGLDVNNRFNVALTVFYILYILVDVPSNWLLKRIGAGIYLPTLILCWGIIGTLMGLTKSYGGLIVCRLLLGLFEGGLFGGMILYLSMFYRRHQLLLRMGLWYCASPLSGAIGGLLAAGLSQISHGGYNSWPWIFIVEGAVTVVVAVISFWFLPNTPGTSHFLSAEEREGALQRLRFDAHGARAATEVDYEKFDWRWVKMAVFNINSVLGCLNFLTILVPIYSFALFLPTIITGLGYKGVIAQLFTVPPNVVGFFTVIIVAYTSDRFKLRGPFILGGCVLAIIGYAMLLAADRPAVRYGGTFFVAAGVFPNSPAVTAWLNNNLAPHYVRATGTGLQVGIGNCAAFIATFTYLTNDAPRYVTGHSINIGMLVLTMILTVITMVYCKVENSARAKGKRDVLLEKEDEALLGYRHPSFRYTL